MNGIFWLDEIIVKAIHEDQLIQHGGLAGVRDNNLFFASLDRPKNLLAYGEPTPSIFDLAAAYGYGFVVLIMERLANGQESQETISEWLRENSIKY